MERAGCHYSNIIILLYTDTIKHAEHMLTLDRSKGHMAEFSYIYKKVSNNLVNSGRKQTTH